MLMKTKWDEACVTAWQMSTQKVWTCDHLKETKKEAHGKSKGNSREKWEGVNRKKILKTSYELKIQNRPCEGSNILNILAANRLLKRISKSFFLRDRKKVWAAKPSTSWKLVNTVSEKREKRKESIFLKFCFYFTVFTSKEVN